MTEWETVWKPQAGPQKALFDCPADEVFFGGARGGGKTDGVLGKWGNKALKYGSAFNAIMFRRTLPSQDDAWERAKQIYRQVGASFVEGNVKAIRFPAGGRTRFRYIESVSDAEAYQGQNVSDVWVEEVGQYPDPRPIDRLNGILRSPHGIPTQMILTGNPGGAGQLWIKHRYIDPAPKGNKILKRELPNGDALTFVYIPSRITDNKHLLDADPRYVSRLYQVGSEHLVKAWLEGDWNAIEGAFFDGWRTERHVIAPFDIHPDWLRFRSMDWGFAAPFSCAWWVVAGEDYPLRNQVIPRGALVRYREWYGAKAPNVGLRLTAEEVAHGILKREAGEKIAYGVIDPAAFAEDGGPSIAERMFRAGVPFRRADNKRIAQHGAIGGWDQMRARLHGDGERPMLFVFDSCKEFIRTVPVLQHDPDKPEDLDTEQEDHIADECRYACMSRPWITSQQKPPEPGRDIHGITLNELWDLSEGEIRRVRI
jgi:hypothetical protein